MKALLKRLGASGAFLNLVEGFILLGGCISAVCSRIAASTASSDKRLGPSSAVSASSGGAG